MPDPANPLSRQRRLAPNGKPMRALRVLAKAGEPLYEDQVHAEAKRTYSDTVYWYSELRKLCEIGYAKRSGPRGGYRYAITEAGRGALEESQVHA